MSPVTESPPFEWLRTTTADPAIIGEPASQRSCEAGTAMGSQT